MFDIDDFKQFNDDYGHETGDLVLKKLSYVVQKCVHAGDIACRYGGEKFIILFYNTNLEVARRRADELRTHIAAISIKYSHIQLALITISLGISIFPDDPLQIN